MTASGFLNAMRAFNITCSQCRPRVSNYNPVNESGFKTLKYQPDYLGIFTTPEHARQWSHDYYQWDNFVERGRHFDATLYLWRKQAREQGRLMPDSDTAPNGCTSRDKFAAVMKTAAMSEMDVAAYCRENGIYPVQLAQWRAAC